MTCLTNYLVYGNLHCIWSWEHIPNSFCAPLSQIIVMYLQVLECEKNTKLVQTAWWVSSWYFVFILFNNFSMYLECHIRKSSYLSIFISLSASLCCCLFSRNYMNDSLRTDVFLRFSAETVACACIYLSARTLQVGHYSVHLCALNMLTHKVFYSSIPSQVVIHTPAHISTPTTQTKILSKDICSNMISWSI